MFEWFKELAGEIFGSTDWDRIMYNANYDFNNLSEQQKENYKAEFYSSHKDPNMLDEILWSFLGRSNDENQD